MSEDIPASKFVADTVAFILRLEKRKLGINARAAFNTVENNQGTLYIPAVVIAEILYLSEKNRIAISLKNVQEYIERFPDCQEYPLSFAVIESARAITDIPELHDRLIAATARHINVPLITNDTVIVASTHVKTIW